MATFVKINQEFVDAVNITRELTVYEVPAWVNYKTYQGEMIAPDEYIALYPSHFITYETVELDQGVYDSLP